MTQYRTTQYANVVKVKYKSLEKIDNSKLNIFLWNTADIANKGYPKDKETSKKTKSKGWQMKFSNYWQRETADKAKKWYMVSDVKEIH